MTPNKPYLIRAIHEWICDNSLTTHLAVHADYPGVEVPRDFVTEDGQIILNIAPRAVQNLEAGNEEITFSARFSGRPMQIRVPIAAVLAVYARENGQGMAFGPEQPPEPPEGEKGGSGKGSGNGGRPSLKVVK